MLFGTPRLNFDEWSHQSIRLNRWSFTPFHGTSTSLWTFQIRKKFFILKFANPIFCRKKIKMN